MRTPSETLNYLKYVIIDKLIHSGVALRKIGELKVRLSRSELKKRCQDYSYHIMVLAGSVQDLHNLHQQATITDENGDNILLIYLKKVLTNSKSHIDIDHYINILETMMSHDKLIIIKQNKQNISILDQFIKLNNTRCKNLLTTHKDSHEFKKIIFLTSLFIFTVYYIKKNKITYSQKTVQKYPKDVRKYLQLIY